MKHINIHEEVKTDTCWTAIVRDAETYEVKRIIPFHNVVLDQWKEKISKAQNGDLRETGDDIDDLEDKLYIRYHQLGTDDTTAAVTDTDLIEPDTDTFGQISSVEQQNGEVTTYSFWDEGLAIGDWREFAIYTGDEEAVIRANIQQNIGEGETLSIHGVIRQV